MLKVYDRQYGNTWVNVNLEYMAFLQRRCMTTFSRNLGHSPSLIRPAIDDQVSNHSSRPQVSRRSCRSSLAIRRFTPHRDCTASNTCFCICFFSGLASQTMAIKIGEHSNRLASLYLLQVIGSLNRSLRISSMSEGVKWYFRSGSVLYTPGSSSTLDVTEVKLSARIDLRASSAGRNLLGV